MQSITGSRMLTNEDTRLKPRADKLNVGCGNDIKAGWINLDIAPLPGVDVVHDLIRFPWPFEDNQFSEILMINVLEHLPDTIRAMEELHRISQPGCKLTIRIPYYNSPDMFTDPTHRAFFNEHTFDFFDPETRHCRERPYYSTARFKIERIYFYLRIFGLYVKIKNKIINAFLAMLASHFGGIIWVEEFDLQALK